MSFETTTEEVLAGADLSGQTIVVTGASSGLGEETAQALASVGAHVVMAVRDEGKGEAAAERIRARHPHASLELHELDLGSLANVRRSAEELLRRHNRVDRLVNNAGVMAAPLSHTADGFELQLGTNHLGHFLWTARVLPAVLAAVPARIVNLSSRGHVRGDIGWDDPHYRSRPYDKWEAYGQSKTANILFTIELDRRLRDRGVRSYAVHPGVIMTELSRHLVPEDLDALAARMPAGAMTHLTGACRRRWGLSRGLCDCRAGDGQPADERIRGSRDGSGSGAPAVDVVGGAGRGGVPGLMLRRLQPLVERCAHRRNQVGDAVGAATGLRDGIDQTRSCSDERGAGAGDRAVCGDGDCCHDRSTRLGPATVVRCSAQSGSDMADLTHGLFGPNST